MSTPMYPEDDDDDTEDPTNDLCDEHSTPEEDMVSRYLRETGESKESVDRLLDTLCDRTN